jgi:hypothetical protein
MLMCLAMLVGCSAPTGRFSFDLEVKNESVRPVTVWLTKSAGPAEDGWQSPEELAINKLWASDTFPAVTIPAKTTVRREQIVGEFGPDSRAVLRVYDGVQRFEEVLAISAGRGREDVTLQPGPNLVVVRSQPEFAVERTGK